MSTAAPVVAFALLCATAGLARADDATAASAASLRALSAAPQARFEKRIRDWYAAIELYPRQLHDLGQGEYLDMKRKENLRQLPGPV